MTGRVIASLAFIAGGIATWFVLKALLAFGASQAEMSASAGSASSSVDAVILGLVGSYFAASAIGVVVCRKKEALRVVALVAHLFLMAGFFAICSTGIGKGAEKFLTGVLIIVVVALVYFLPWFIVWSALLFGRKRDA